MFAKKPAKKQAAKPEAKDRKAPPKPAAKKEGTEKSAQDGKKMKTPELLRGFRDILPDEQVYWDMLRDKAREMSEAYSYQRIDLPVIEREELFRRTIGKQTDIVEKEMYAFEDRGGDKVALRPEFTASAVRAYISHGMLDRPQPVKFFYTGPVFRYDRPQAGRFRQHHQVGFEAIGSPEAIMDAQLIVMAYNLLKELGIPTTVRINSIGTPESRREYEVELTSYYRSKRANLCEDCKRRLQKNPLRLLDCKDEGCQPIKAEAPQMINFLDEASKEHFMRVFEFLDEAEVPYQLDPYLVRGLDYYTKTVFELWMTDETGQRASYALGGGGRYDGLVEMLGGREGTPACGFAIGMERVVSTMRELQVIPKMRQPHLFFAQLGDAARRQGIRIFEDFRKANIFTVEAFGKGSLKAQLEMANKLGVFYSLILGQKEVIDGTIIIRDMESGAQEIVDIKKILSIMQKKLEGVEHLARPIPVPEPESERYIAVDPIDKTDLV